MSVPFTQFMMPDGRKVKVSIEMSNEIEQLARKFIIAGGWFECEMLSDKTMVSLTACWHRPDGDNDVESELVPNGPEVPKAVERLIRRAAAFADAQKSVRPRLNRKLH